MIHTDNMFIKKSPIAFLQAVIIFLGIAALAFLLWEPHIEGRNAHATVFQIYLNDPFLAYVYVGSIAFFVALYQAFRLLGCVGRNEIFSQSAVKASRTIKYCFMILIAFILGAEAYFFLFQRGKDDIAGGVAMGLVLTFVSVIAASAASIFERTLQHAVDIRSENDLTI